MPIRVDLATLTESIIKVRLYQYSHPCHPYSGYPLAEPNSSGCQKLLRRVHVARPREFAGVRLLPAYNHCSHFNIGAVQWLHKFTLLWDRSESYVIPPCAHCLNSEPVASSPSRRNGLLRMRFDVFQHQQGLRQPQKCAIL